MSNSILTPLPGFAWPVERYPVWDTKVQTSVSGKEVRLGNWSYPYWKYSIPVELLRSKGAYTELQDLVGFYNARRGSYDSWLFNDLNDNTVVNQNIGTGDGVNQSFQLARLYGGYLEPVLAPGLFTVSRNGTKFWPGLRTNLLTDSENVPAWFAQTGVTVTSNVAANPVTGAVNADLVDVTSASVNTGVLQAAYTSFTGLTNTKSVWLKGFAGGEVVNLSDPGFTQGVVTCNLTTSWQRFSLTEAAQTTAAGVWVKKNTGNKFYVWGGQLELSPIVTGYIPTTTTAASITDFTVNSRGLVTFPYAPANGDVMTWDGNFYWRCRFEKDNLPVSMWADGWSDLKALEFRTLK